MHADTPLTRAELAAAAERTFRTTFPNLARHGRAGISERTIRFWTREGLLPPRGGPNRLGRYEPALVHRCVLIRRLAHERALGLADIRAVLALLDEDAVRSAAEGGALPAAVDRVLENASAGADVPVRPAAPAPQAATTAPPVPTSAAAATAAEPAVDDRPRGLQRLSDADRAQVLADALRSVLERGFEVSLLGFECAVRGYRGGFGTPSALDWEVRPNAASGDPAAAVDALQRLPDDTLCAAIADALSARVGEPCRVEPLFKRYLRPATLPERRQPTGLHLAVLVAAGS